MLGNLATAVLVAALAASYLNRSWLEDVQGFMNEAIVDCANFAFMVKDGTGGNMNQPRMAYCIVRQCLLKATQSISIPYPDDRRLIIMQVLARFPS